MPCTSVCLIAFMYDDVRTVLGETDKVAMSCFYSSHVPAQLLCLTYRGSCKILGESQLDTKTTEKRTTGVRWKKKNVEIMFQSSATWRSLVEFIDNRKSQCVLNHICMPVCYRLTAACVLRHRFTQILDCWEKHYYLFTTLDVTNDANVGRKTCLGSATFGVSGKL